MTAPLSELPSHVSADLVHHFDLYQPIEGADDYQTWFTKLQAAGTPDIFWTRHNGGHWVVTRGEDFDHILKNPDTYSSRVNVVPRERLMPIVSKPIQLDPPDHTRYRNLLTPAFSPKAVVPLGEKSAGADDRADRGISCSWSLRVRLRVRPPPANRHLHGHGRAAGDRS
ncbi:cytochrome P450 [Metapseudomonas furukawaii]|uniref:hypothetical protein n=1 Tax=Metapseudomonas furukawaii TaxID=1149133 RepID=UPI00227A17CF|nr:hypothetical protein [Pseudomonas furukawaii]WAG81086.1 cytochrome P450 [Pseudomonas furukawaii]